MDKIITGNCFAIINDVVNSVKNPVIVTDPRSISAIIMRDTKINFRKKHIIKIYLN